MSLKKKEEGPVYDYESDVCPWLRAGWKRTGRAHVVYRRRGSTEIDLTCGRYLAREIIRALETYLENSE